jgi:hypothetical protein
VHLAVVAAHADDGAGRGVKDVAGLLPCVKAVRRQHGDALTGYGDSVNVHCPLHGRVVRVGVNNSLLL